VVVGLMNLFDIEIRNLAGDCFILEVESNESIRSVKTKMVQRVGIPASQQHLTFNQTVLVNHRVLSDYSIQKGDALTLIRQAVDWRIQIILLDGRPSPYLKCKSNTLLSELKQLVQEELKIPVEFQLARMGGGVSIALEPDDITLEALGLRDNAAVWLHQDHLDQSLQVFRDVRRHERTRRE
jgi:hypothetical protein